MFSKEGKLFLHLTLFAALIGLSGCATYQQQNKFAPYYASSDLTMAEREARKKADDKENGKDAIIWRLEAATILRAAEKFDDSNKAFDQAELHIDKFAEEAKVKVASETGALFSNQAELPYRGRCYDGIMLSTYKALNFLQLNDADKARVELNRAYERQKDAVEENKKRIEKTEEEVAKHKNREQIEKARDDSKLKGQIDTSCSDLERLKIYSDYVNPFTVYLDGLFSMAQASGPSDLERARKSFERALSCAEDNKFVRQDLETVEALSQGKALSPTTYVIFETGRAPVRDQIRIDIPIIFSKVSYVGAAFPKLTMQGNYLPALQVCGGGATENTALVASMDSIVGSDFKNELPTIITKTIASTVVKAAASYVVNDATTKKNGSSGDAVAAIFMRLGTAIYQAAVNIADLRTWTTLPKEIQVCRIPTPADRKITLSGSGGASKREVNVAEGTVNVVFVKSISNTGPLLVSQFKLK